MSRERYLARNPGRFAKSPSAYAKLEPSRYLRPLPGVFGFLSLLLLTGRLGFRGSSLPLFFELRWDAEEMEVCNGVWFPFPRHSDPAVALR